MEHTGKPFFTAIAILAAVLLSPAVPAAEGLAGVAAISSSAEEAALPEGPPAVLIGSSDEQGLFLDNESELDDVGGIGYHVNVDCTDFSNVVIIGDSRIVGVSLNVGGVSYNATVGAHYLYEEAWASRKVPMIIHNGLDQREDSSTDPTGYYGEMVALVRKCIRKHGSCFVVLSSTVNDILFSDWCSKEIDRMFALGDALKEDGSLYGRSPIVYYFGMVPLQGEFTTKTNGASPEEFNDLLAGQVSDRGDSYIGIGPISAWNELYAGDGIHFQSEGSHLYFDLISARLLDDWAP